MVLALCEPRHAVVTHLMCETEPPVLLQGPEGKLITRADSVTTQKVPLEASALAHE